MAINAETMLSPRPLLGYLKNWVSQKGYLLLTLGAGIFAFFYNLGDFPIFQWDEARYVNNSLEVLTLGNWWQYTMDGAVDTWNFKPPLVLWLQSASMWLLGANEFAARLPSALAGVGILLLIHHFCIKVFDARNISIASQIFFLGSCGFIGPHIGRTADLDAVQTFFVFFYTSLFLRSILLPQRIKYRNGYLGVLIVCAFLCKGMPGLLLLPFLLLIALLPNNFRRVFSDKTLYPAAFLTLLVCAAYYLVRDCQMPGYWEMLKKSEFNRFSGKGIEWHIQPFDFYFQNFITLKRYFFLIYLLPFTGIVYVLPSIRLVKTTILYLHIILIGYFLFISIAPVKLEWYDAPFYPIFALLFGIMMGALAQQLPYKRLVPSATATFVTALISIILCWPHLRQTWENIQYTPEKMANFEYPGVVIKALTRTTPRELKYGVLMINKPEEHKDQVKFYQKSMRLTDNAEIKIVDRFDQLSQDDKVLVCEQQWIDSLNRRFPFSAVLYESGQGKLLQLK